MTDLASTEPRQARDAPQPPRQRALLVGSIVAGSVLLVGAGLGIGYAVVAGQHTPERQVTAFLQDLVSGNAELALARIADVPEGSPLLSDEVYGAATDRVSAFEIVDATRDGDHATVSATITQGSTSYERAFTLSRVGSELVFDVWSIDGGQLPTFQVSFIRPDTVTPTANGIDLGSSLNGLDAVPVLPGTYEFAAEGTTDSYGVEPTAGTVTFEDTDSPVNLSLSVLLTEQGVAAAVTAVTAHTDACVAQPVLRPSGGCWFNVVDDGYDYSNQRWTVLARPTFSFGEWTGDTDSGGWELIPGAVGAVRWDADVPTGTAEASWDDYMPRGRITSFTEDGTATFVSRFDE